MRMRSLFIAFVLAGSAGSAVAQMTGVPSMTMPSTGAAASSPSVTSMSNEDLVKQYCQLQNPSQSSGQSGSSMMSAMSKGGMTDAAKQAASDKMKAEVADELKRRSITLPGCS